MTEQSRAKWKQTPACRENWVMTKMALQNTEEMLHYLENGGEIRLLSI